MTCRQHVAHRHHEVASLGEHLLGIVEELLIAVEVEFIGSVLSLELRQFLAGNELPLAGITEDYVASLYCGEEHVASLLTIFPQILTIVNVHRGVDASAECLVKTVESSVAGTFRKST